MSDIVLNTLKREVKRKQSRIDKLETLMSERHTKSETAKNMDAFARRFNASETAKEKIAVANEWNATSDEWERQVEASRKQNDNYMRWADEQLRLMTEVGEMNNEIHTQEFRKSMRKSLKSTKRPQK